MAQLAMEANRYSLALPLLRDVCRMIDEYHLDSWEPAEWVGRPLAMLCRCLEHIGEDPLERKRAYDRLCVVDPTGTLDLEP